MPNPPSVHKKWSEKRMKRLSFVDIGNVRLCALLLVSVLLMAVPALAMAEEGGNYPMLQYDAQRTGNVSGIAPETDTLLWQSNEKTAGCIEAGPIVSDGKVYISTWWSAGMGVEGNAVDALYCLDEDTGEEIWNNTEVYGASTAAIAEGKLFVGTHRGNITCVDATSGAILWSKKIEEEFWGGVTSSPLVFGDEVYVLSVSNGTLHAFSFGGTELWNFSSGGEIFCYSSPSAYDNKIFFAGNDSGQHALYCLDLNTRGEVWKFTTETEIRGSPTIWGEEGMVFFTTKYVYGKARKLYVVDITTGEEIWNVTHYSSWASPALSNGKLYIGGSAVDTAFYCYDAGDGTLIWENEEMEGAIDSSPVVADGKVYFGTNEVDGTVYALDANSGSIIWDYTLYVPSEFGGGYNIASPPAISDRTLFIGVDNVGVLAFRYSVFWGGDVTLIENTTVNVTAYNSGESYAINQTTALGALDAAADAGEFNYTVSDEWYTSYGSFLLTSIAGIENEPWPGDTWYIYINNESAPYGLGLNMLGNGDTVSFFYGEYGIPDNASTVIRIHVLIIPSSVIFDTGAPENPYPSIFDFHYGNITPSHDVYVTNMYTYSCAGTGGHSEEAAFYNSTTGAQIAKGTWNGYAVGDYQYIEFDEPFVLHHWTTYNFVIRTGSYPQIHHKNTLDVGDGTITCTNFTDANGKIYNDRILAIRLE